MTPRFHPGLPDVKTGTRVAKVTLLKDLPSTVRIAGFDLRLWYLGQPQSCPICPQFGHHVRDCPLNGLCRRCRQPGNMARECPSRRSSAVVVPAPALGVDTSVSADEGEDLNYVYFSASESDVVSDEEEAVDACSGDEEVLKSAAPDHEVASRTRKRVLSESFLESIVSAESPVDLHGQSALAGSQPSLSSGPDVPALSVPVRRSVPPPVRRSLLICRPLVFPLSKWRMLSLVLIVVSSRGPLMLMCLQILSSPMFL